MLRRTRSLYTTFMIYWRKLCVDLNLQERTIEEYDAMFDELQAAKEMRIEYEKLIAEHPKENAILNNIVEESSTSCKRLSKVNDIGQFFSMKLKKRGSARNIQIRKCDQPLCDSTNVDMVRCNICSNLVCEQCHDVQVGKLKSLVERCQTIYFICHNCDNNDITVTLKTADENNSLNTVSAESPNTLLATLHDSINSTIHNLESKVENLIKTKIDEKMEEMSNKFEALAQIPDKINKNCETFKDALTKNLPLTNPTNDFKAVMIESRNEQLAQAQQIKLRSKNIIIHGVKEDAEEKQDEADKDFVNNLLTILRLEVMPEQIVRLGKKVIDKDRPLRIKMKDERVRDTIMSRLTYLKDAEEKFSKISVTYDYTVEERQLIKTWVDKAKEKSEKETENFIWKVRGDPKNGLRLMKVTKRSPQSTQ